LKITEGLQDVSDYSKAICMLLTPPNSELHKKMEKWGSKLPQNDQTRTKTKHSDIHSPSSALIASPKKKKIRKTSESSPGRGLKGVERKIAPGI
jgi:hypothetical protein